jgi:hypothetical protein
MPADQAAAVALLPKNIIVREFFGPQSIPYSQRRFCFLA